MSKKNVEVPSIEEALAKRKITKNRIDEIIIQLGRFGNLSQLGIACGDSMSRAKSFLNNRGNGVEASLSENHLREYNALKEDTEKKRAVYSADKQKDAALRKELAELQVELENHDHYACAGDVKKYQNEADEIEVHIKELNQAIIRESEKATQSNAVSDELKSLHREREDLMADMAIGAINNDVRLAEIEALISKEESRISEAKKIGAAAKIVVAGLQRKITEAEQKLADVKETLQSVYGEFLISEAEKEGAKFIELSGKLWDQFSRLIALGTMIENHPGTNGISIISGNCRNIKLPLFNLKSCPDDQEESGFYRTFNQLNISDEVYTVKRDFAALGISI
jgi:hypothetical protein